MALLPSKSILIISSGHGAIWFSSMDQLRDRVDFASILHGVVLVSSEKVS